MKLELFPTVSCDPASIKDSLVPRPSSWQSGQAHCDNTCVALQLHIAVLSSCFVVFLGGAGPVYIQLWQGLLRRKVYFGVLFSLHM